MTITKLALYNNALSTYLGQRKLSAVDEDRPPRYDLDTAYDLGAVIFCLEAAKPVFARDTYVSTSSTQDAAHGSSYIHDFPSDYITVVGLYADVTKDTPIDRYTIEGGTFICDYSTVYLRYVSNSVEETYTNWSMAFANVVSCYLAAQVSTKIAPDEYEKLVSRFSEEVKVLKELDNTIEPTRRPSKTTGNLTETWREIYNDALFALGLDEITSNVDDSDRRIKLDHVLATGIVEDLLEDVGWNFARTSIHSQYDASLEPEWGYTKVHDLPTNFHRMDGVFTDEAMKTPLKYYTEESGRIFCDYQDIYIQYISSDWLVTPDLWPHFFRKLVAARMAMDISASIDGADTERARTIYQERRNSAISNNVVASPPRVLAEGSWVRSRGRRDYSGRP